MTDARSPRCCHRRAPEPHGHRRCAHGILATRRPRYSPSPPSLRPPLPAALCHTPIEAGGGGEPWRGERAPLPEDVQATALACRCEV
uniref:Uncharacterized protein n=1 Tax=Arundo donax TaxID=35708 RepID=A0A0A9GP61_ARUDO